jgi:hypothetical protein
MADPASRGPGWTTVFANSPDGAVDSAGTGAGNGGEAQSKRQRRTPTRAQPCGRAPHPTKGKDVQSINGRSAIFARGEALDQRIRGYYRQGPRKRRLPRAERTQRSPRPAAHSKCGQRGDRRRPGYPNPNRAQNAVFAQRCDHSPDRTRLKAELSDERDVKTVVPSRSDLGAQDSIEVAANDPWVPRGITGEGDMTDAVAFQKPGLQQIQTVAERTGGLGRITSDQQHAFDPSLADGTPQETTHLGKTRESAGCDMWHGDKSGSLKLDTSGDDVMVGEAAGMINKHSHPGCQQLAQSLVCRVVARRDFDRGVADQIRNAARPLLVARRRRAPHRGRECHPESLLREIT